MIKGVYITLLIGPTVPIPVPKSVVDAITSIQVTNSITKSGFQITFNVSKTSALITEMLAAGYFSSITTRVMIIASLNGTPNVLIDGIVSHHQMAPSNEPGKTIFTITGEDVSLAMDLVELISPFPAMPDVAKITTLLSPFAVFGITPLIVPPAISPVRSPTDKWESINKKTPLAYLKEIAQRCGYIFTVISGPLPGQNIAYFGPEINLPLPQRAMSVNMDANTNVESLSFSMDGKEKKLNIYTIMDEVTRKITVPIPVPGINLLRPPLGLLPTQPVLRSGFSDDMSGKTTAEALRAIMGDLMSSVKNPAAIKGNGSLNVLRYKSILRAGMLVGVRGAGLAYDGMYNVDSVTHDIKPGEYKQSFNISRDGLFAATPLVIT